MKPFEIEKIVRDKLGEMFGTKFRKQKLVIGYDSKKKTSNTRVRSHFREHGHDRRNQIWKMLKKKS